MSFAQHHRVAEGAEIALQVLHRLAATLIDEMNRNVGLFAGDDLRGLDLQFDRVAVRGLHERRVGLEVRPRRAMSPSKPAVVSGVAIICGPPPTGMKSLNSTYCPPPAACLDRERAVLLEHRVLVEELRHVAARR
jgi:hypothetical protein